MTKEVNQMSEKEEMTQQEYEAEQKILYPEEDIYSLTNSIDHLIFNQGKNSTLGISKTLIHIGCEMMEGCYPDPKMCLKSVMETVNIALKIDENN